MAAKRFTYEYSVDAITFMNGNKQTEIEPSMVSVIIIDHDYVNNIAPAIYVRVNVTPIVFNEMVINQKKSKIFLHVKSYEAEHDNPIHKDYIKEQFSYFLSNEILDYDTDLVKESESDDKSTRSIVLGLIKSELIDSDKKIINDIYKGTNSMSIIHEYTKDMNMVIEPFDNDTNHNLLIIPPIEGVSKLLKYLNESNSFYDTNYRYYLDFSKTYLISTRGKAIDIKDGTFKTIKIEIKKTTDMKKDNVGVLKDEDNKIYTIEVSSGNFSINMNKVTEKKFNKFLAVDARGSTSNKKLKIHNEKGSSEKTKVVRVYNNNLKYLNTLVDDIENTSAMITVVKGDIDCSLIVPYKEYRISNLSEHKGLDGKYILEGKKEVLVNSGGKFICSVSMNFKIIS